MTQTAERVMVYIDGFNLYFGLASRFSKLKWLNVYALSANLLKPHQTLIGVKYFTARLSGNPPKERRQNIYLKALQTTPTEIFYGQYKSGSTSCTQCHHTWTTNEEKMTDVNIAVQMLLDAVDNFFDTALVISGDSDLAPPIRSVQDKFGKKVVVVFPPDRYNGSICQLATGYYMLGKQKIMNSQFPMTILTASGYPITKPQEWK